MIICDTISYIGKTPQLYNLESKMYSEKDKEWLVKKNHAIKVFANLYETGVLREKGFVQEIKGKNNSMFIDYVVDSNKLTLDETILGMFPSTPCIFSGCISICEGITMNTYRDNSGNISRSWETSTIQGLDNKACSAVLDRYKKKGAVEAGILAIKLANNLITV